MLGLMAFSMWVKAKAGAAMFCCAEHLGTKAESMP
jgi:hypothetical protein